MIFFLQLHQILISQREIKIIDNGNFYFHNVVFLSITYSGTGGAISFYSSSELTNKILIEETLFSECKTTSNERGGAIYFEYYGDCQFHLVCGNDCKTNSNQYGQFCSLYSYTNHKYFLSFKLTSVINCYNFVSGSWATIHFLYGTQTLDNIKYF